MAAICYHRWHAQLCLLLGAFTRNGRCSYDFRAWYIFEQAEKQESIASKAHLQKTHILYNTDADSASFSILAIRTTFLSTPNKELITHETVGSNLHTFNPLQEAAALFTIKVIGVSSRDLL